MVDSMINEELIGYIEHRLEFCRQGQKKLKSKRGRKRNLEKSSSNPDHEKKQPEISSSESNSSNHVGFFFITADEVGMECKDNDKLENATRLIVPQSMLKRVCDVVRSRSKVVLIDISFVRWDDGEISNRQRWRREEINFIVLHHGGLRLFMTQEASVQVPSIPLQSNRSAPLSLEELQIVEQSMEKERQKVKREGKGKGNSTTAEPKKAQNSASQYYNIYGKVDAISTIITIVPTDPFALIELYDYNYQSISAVVVLKGKSALCCQPGILPGDNLIFYNVLRSRWHVPQSLQKKDVPDRFYHRAPSHVFVVTDPCSIQWSTQQIHSTSLSSQGQGQGQGQATQSENPSLEAADDYPNENIIPPLPSTIDSLSSIQGKVISIHTSSKCNIVDYIMLKSDGDDKTSSLSITTRTMFARYYKLYLLYYPMSPDLHFGLDVGAYVRAINIHEIPTTYCSLDKKEKDNTTNEHDYDFTCYGACLRSTVTVLVHNHENNKSKAHLQRIFDIKKQHKKYKDGNQHRVVLPMMLKKDQFYMFHNIQYSYTEREWMSQIRFHIFKRLKCNPDTICNILKICLLNCRANNSSTSPGDASSTYRSEGYKITRDPYKEWFDHACEHEKRNEMSEEHYDKTTLCSSVSSSKNFFPVIMGLSQVKTICMERMMQSLSENTSFLKISDTPSTPVGIGWSYSNVFDRNQLLKMTQTSSGSKIKDIYVGGTITETSHDGKVICQLHNELCQLPFVPIFSKSSQFLTSRTVHQVGDFVLIKVARVTVSSLYLGLHKRPDATTFKENQTKTSCLTPLYAHDTNINCGACQLNYFRGHLFLLSIHIQYYMNQTISQNRSGSNEKNDEITKINTNATTDSTSFKTYNLTKYISDLSHSKLNEKGEEFMYMGKLSNLNWKAYRVRDDEYNGCTMTLSCIPAKGQVTETHDLVSTQSIDLKLSIPIEANNIKSMKTAVNMFFSNGLVLDVLSLACAWRSLAEKFSPALMNDHVSSSFFYVKVLLPHKTKSKKEIKSFVSYGVDSIQVSVEDIYKDCPYQSKEDDQKQFMPIVRSKKLPGSLDPLKQRAVIHDNSTYKGELLLPVEHFHGVPSLSISVLIYRLLHDMTLKQGVSQLVWRIANARLSTLKFCAVRIQCTKCFQFLVSHDGDSLNSNKYTQANRTKGRNSEISNNSFWNCPIPTVSDFTRTKLRNGNSGSVCAKALGCPNGCEDCHAAPKWELSGIVDDGTGSGKLYAERDAALMLLGRGLDVSLVEEGAWQSDSGVVFQRGVPLGAFIKSKMNNLQDYRIQHKSNDAPDFSVTERARIELYRHCMDFEGIIKRKMDYLCRCKKISKDKSSLNSFEMIATSALGQDGKVLQNFPQSNMSPILELQLVDCICCLENSTEIGWSIMKSL